MRLAYVAFVAFFGGVSTACGFVGADRAIDPSDPPSPPAATADDLVEVDPTLVGRFHDDLDRESLVLAVERTIEALASRPADEVVALSDARCSAAELRRSYELLSESLVRGGRPAAHLYGRFRLYRSQGRSGGAFFTGYYEPVIEGRRTRGGRFVYPLYRAPSDLVNVRLDGGGAAPVQIAGRVADGHLDAYFTRRDIDLGEALAGRGLELVWLADPIERYFLHVQGSGVIRLENGGLMRVGFAGSNGRTYTSIGRLLIEDGSLAPGEASSPAIRDYLRRNPQRMDAVLTANERYIFFREMRDGPVGSLGVKLTPGRSIAVDPAYYPPGVLSFIETRAPRLDAAGRVYEEDVRRFVVTQDRGAAITGPGRADLFFGTGERAGQEAGRMSARGSIHFLFPDCP